MKFFTIKLEIEKRLFLHFSIYFFQSTRTLQDKMSAFLLDLPSVCKDFLVLNTFRNELTGDDEL